jgi:hypothetical protein
MILLKYDRDVQLQTSFYEPIPESIIQVHDPHRSGKEPGSGDDQDPLSARAAQPY